jgi:Zinc dependent phospholipase C
VSQRWGKAERLLVTVGIFLVCNTAMSYSVLTHEFIIDSLWNDQITPVLLSKFPDATPDELKEAHAYAYGGSVIQDLGYYPFGQEYFSDLTHYVRTGDFVVNLLSEASNVQEYAFALGALAHYSSDLRGHPAVNRAVALTYPELESKYGPEVTYEENHSAHLSVEFGFDVYQVAMNRFSFNDYHDFIGFEVAKSLLQRAFIRTYGIPLQKAIRQEDLAIGTYRHSVSKTIPKMTKVALAMRGKTPSTESAATQHAVQYQLTTADYETDFGKQYYKPGFGYRVEAALLKLIPPIGPAKKLHYKDPSPETEKLYLESVKATIATYRGFLEELRIGRELDLKNLDVDTGAATKPGEYGLADKTYSKLLRQLAQDHFACVTPGLRENVLGFYSEPSSSNRMTQNKKGWEQTTKALEQLSVRSASAEVAESCKAK